jgi:hypothetical protein
MDDEDQPSELSRFHVAWLSQHGEVRAPLVDAAATAFEEVPPVRDFPSYRGQRHFPGLYYSVTTDRHLGYESWLERDHAMLLDFDPQVTGFASQPFWLFWPQGQRTRSHAPDFFARRADGTGVVVDVRADDRIEPRDAEAFAATEQACAEVGWLYRRVGEIERCRVTNLRWLAGYRHPRHGEPAQLAESAVAAFAIPAPLLVQAATVGDPIEVLPMVFHLLWRGVLMADLSRPLGDRTLVAANEALR